MQGQPIVISISAQLVHSNLDWCETSRTESVSEGGGEGEFDCRLASSSG
jgi:hypothetical protein